MKANTPDLMKFQRLQRKLGESRRGTIGLLEGLWIAAAKNCPQGDIGRFDNEEIAILCDWDGDADLLVSTLVECGWLDECLDHRLIVHDWVDHCPTYVKGGLAKRHKEVFIPRKELCKSATTSEVQAEPHSGTTPEVQAIGTTSEVPSTKPSLFKPDQAKSDHTADGVCGAQLESDSCQRKSSCSREVFDYWNAKSAVCPQIASARVLSPERQKKLSARLNNAQWPWREAIDLLPLPGDPDQWQPDFDWFVRNDSNAERIANKSFQWRNKPQAAREEPIRRMPPVPRSIHG